MSGDEMMLQRIGREYAELLDVIQREFRLDLNDAAAFVARMAKAGYVWTKADAS